MKIEGLKAILNLIILVLFTSCIFPKSNNQVQESNSVTESFTNRSIVPLITECKNNHTEACFQNTLSSLILDEAKRRDLILEKDTLKVSIRINKDGSAYLFDNESNNFLLKEVSSDVLNSLPSIQPAYSEKKQDYVAVSYSWYILIEDNEMINKFK